MQTEQLGAIEPSDVINRMTFDSGSTNVTHAFSGGDDNTGQTNVNLRNLGLGLTPMLLDGKRRVPGSSDANANTFVSLSTLLPGMAIARFEIVKDGASSLYGADAIAGVVNVISCDEFEGFELTLGYRADQQTGDQDDNTIGATWGVQGNPGGIVVSAEYLDRGGLQIADRFDDSGRSGVSALGQPGASVVGAAPGVDPAVAQAVSTGHLAGGAISFGRVLGVGPDSPFALRPVDTDTRESTDEFRLVSGLRRDLGLGNWTYDAPFTFSQRDNQGRHIDTRQQQPELALNGFGGAQCNPTNPSESAGSGSLGAGNGFYWNPSASSLIKPDGSLQDDPLLSNSPEVFDWMVGEIRNFTEAEQNVVGVVVTGDVAELPFSSQPLAMAAGFRWRQDRISPDLDQDSNVNNFSFIFGVQDFSGGENTCAGFLEFSIPVGETLEIQAAGRFEYFDELSDEIWNPKSTGLWTPRDDLTLRASWGTSFRVGSLLQRFWQTAQLLHIADRPFSGTSLAFRLVITNGNADLAPEDATAYNFGRSCRPSEGALANLRVDIDYYSYEIADLITRQGFDELIQRDIASRCPQGPNADPTDGIPDCAQQADGSVVTVGPGIPEVVRAGAEPAAGDDRRNRRGGPGYCQRDDLGPAVPVGAAVHGIVCRRVDAVARRYQCLQSGAAQGQCGWRLRSDRG